MSMSKQDFIALADTIRLHNQQAELPYQTVVPFTPDQIDAIAYFCKHRNYAFKADRWKAYIRGECSPGGGTIPSAKERRS